jgi:hypothetical protein
VLALTLLASIAAASPVLAQGGDAESDAPDGTSAFHQLADARGHRVGLIHDSFQLPPTSQVLFVISPELPFKSGEADAVARWVEAGGVLVYAATAPDPVLESALGISRAAGGLTYDTEADATAATPLLAGVRHVRIGPVTSFRPPEGDQVAFLRAVADDQVVGLEAARGTGHFFALASSTVLDNQTIAVDDNGRLGGDLLAAAGPSAPVTFDQYHHLGGSGGTSSLAWLTTPWGLAILLEVLLVFGLLAIGGRAFGPRIPLHPAADPSSAEFTSAVGAMLRRARARPQTIARLLTATRAALAEQVGLRDTAAPERLEGVLRRRSPGLADALGHATASAATVNDERSLAQAAAELHRLAHPALGDTGAPPATPTRRKN